MFIHMFSFRWKPGVTDQQKQRVLDEVTALQTQIPGILDSAAGFNTSPRGQGYEFGGVMKFSNRAAYEAANFHLPCLVGDYLEITGTVLSRGNRSRRVGLKAYRYVRAPRHDDGSPYILCDPPELVADAVLVAVSPK